MSQYDKVQVQLVTISPGSEYWSAFGHSAIRIKSPLSDQMFGFGYFDFADEDFFINFAQGKMSYFLGVVDSQYELSGYKKEGRKVVLQNLQLTPEQKQKIVNKLQFLAKPENRYYQYDYFLNNCTSKIRDLIDEATNGEISAQLKPLNTNISWKDHTFPVKNQAWVNLGIAFAYGLGAYENQNQWQLSVFPEVFSQDITQIKTQNNWNTDYQVYYQPNASEMLNQQNSFAKSHYAVLLIVGLLLVGLLFKKSMKPTMIFWLVIQNILGTVIVLLWFFTQHNIAAWNINLLIFSPIAVLMLFNKPKRNFISNLFLGSNVVWLILSIIYTQLYLIGFFLVNLLIWKNHRQE